MLAAREGLDEMLEVAGDESLWDRLDELDARFDSVTGYEELSPFAPGQPVISFADSFKVVAGGSFFQFRKSGGSTCAADGEGRQPALSSSCAGSHT